MASIPAGEPAGYFHPVSTRPVSSYDALIQPAKQKPPKCPLCVLGCLAGPSISGSHLFHSLTCASERSDRVERALMAPQDYFRTKPLRQLRNRAFPVLINIRGFPTRKSI